MRTNKLKKTLNKKYGTRPDLHYFDGDMKGIRAYFDYRYDNKLDEFLIDDTTWKDLSGDEIYKRINQGTSTSGEQYLYYLLRSPTVKRREYEKRAKLIELMENNPDLRLDLQVIFTKLSKRRSANTSEMFSPDSHSPVKLVFYILLVLTFIGSAVSLAFTFKLAWLFVIMMVGLPIFRQFAVYHIESDIDTVNYSAAMVYAARKIKNLNSSELSPLLSTFYEASERLKSISRIGAVPTNNTVDDIAAILNGIFLADIIAYEFLKTRLGKHQKDIFHIHEYLGLIDSAIAVASYRKSLLTYSIPKIDFIISDKVRFNALNLVHPLVENAVPNDLNTTESILLTGSNASGKSTFLRTVAVNAIMAQGICTALCGEYSAPAFRIYTSMAISDNLLAGESYFIAEIKSLKRIMITETSEQPLLCIIDEVLRGTNTVERIAASSELLKELKAKNALCLAATHDIELCALLSSYYRLLHFSETVTDNGEVLFDYMIKDGAATTRNALKLLNSIGFDKEMVNRAHEKANRYIADGKWA
ncbi:MAG: hypothetical protein FWG70_11870 [Oscillospiraceae bacterium]|nr:hypothetical protein [Oscillospiraceae bacterium]